MGGGECTGICWDGVLWNVITNFKPLYTYLYSMAQIHDSINCFIKFQKMAIYGPWRTIDFLKSVIFEANPSPLILT